MGKQARNQSLDKHACTQAVAFFGSLKHSITSPTGFKKLLQVLLSVDLARIRNEHIQAECLHAA